MLILSMDSSAKPASVAVCNDNILLGQYFQNSGHTHSRTLLSMTEDLLKNLDLKISDIDLIAVSQGPGSFTGIRIGVSAVKGLAWGSDKPVCGVSALEAMAMQTKQTDAIICSVMDARRDQVYNALFTWKEDKLIRLCDDRAISLEDLTLELKNKTAPIYLIGDGAELTFDYFSNTSISCKLAPMLLRFQTAYGVALAAMQTKPTNATDLEATYLRPSQAERERLGRAKQAPPTAP